MSVKYQTEDLPPRRVFLSELSEEFLEKRTAVVVVGTVIQQLRSSDILNVFFLEDITRAQVVEVFSSRLSPDFSISKGDILEIKGVFSKNNYGEKVLKAFKIRKTDLNSEMVHYLEVLAGRSPCDEEAILASAAAQAEKEAAPVLPRRELLERKVRSLVFGFFLKNSHRFAAENGFAPIEEILACNEIRSLRKKMPEAEFDEILEAVTQKLVAARLASPFTGGLIVNLGFFQHFEDAFVAELKTSNTKTFTFREIFDVFNRLASASTDLHFVNKEFFYEFVNKLMFRKHLYFVDEKQETFGVF